MDDKNYKSILMKSPFGFAYHKIIVDNQGIPVDYEFLEVNPAFECITGLKAKEIIGKTVCEVVPGIRENDFDCVKFYGDIALDGGDGEFEQYSKQLSSWYKVQAYSDKKYYFSTVFTDTTARKSLSDIAATFNNFSAQTIDIQYLADKAREISGAAYAVLNKFDENGRDFSTLAFSGMNKHLEKAISMLGFDPRGKKWDYDPERQKKIDNQKTTVFQQLSDLTGTTISKKIITLISKTLNIEQVAVVKTTRENIMLGDFTLMFKRGTQLQNRETLETYADLTGMLLSRIDEERKAINEQARLKTITDNMTDLVWESDLQFINTYTSPSVNRIFGFSIEEYMPLTLEERLAPESLQIALSLLQEELEKENDPRVSKSRSRLVELEYFRKDGSIIPMESNISFVRDKNGKPVGLRGVSRDITERKKAEEYLQKFKQIVSSTSDGIALLDKNYSYVIVNKAYENFSAKKQEDLIGLTVSEYLGEEVFNKFIKANFDRCLNGETIKYRDWFEYQALGKRFVEVSYFPYINAMGMISGVVANSRDITERKQAEKELIKAKEKAEESDRLKTAFINNISHEVRTPLNGILGFGDLIMEEGLSVSEKQNYYKVLRDSSKRLQDTISDILDISELTAGSIKPAPASVHLGQLMNNMLETTQYACAKKNILVTLKSPEKYENLVLQTDGELLAKILSHLLNNAEKFTSEGRITLGFEVKDKWVEFFVSDTGKGIAADKLDAVLEPFMQEDASVTRGHEGSGLGLTIVRHVAELLGGKLWAESVKGKGSTFFFTLPLVSAEPKAESRQPGVAQAEKSGNNLILIAEDEESNYMLLKTVAEGAGFSTLHAIHGAEAVELCHQYPEIGLILMDIKMPVMNGLLATKHIKSFRPDLPVIALTAHAQTGDRQRMLDAGCDEYMAKPVKLEALNALIKKMIT